VVVEAAAKSGSLITARDAADLGREVLAVPGHPIDARAGGCNMLIRDGATLVRDAADVIEALGAISAPAPQRAATAPRGEIIAPVIPATRPAARPLREAAALHGLILDRLGPSPLAVDQLRRDVDASEAEVAPVLLDLELDGRIRRHAGGLVSRV
jgi:DNA processing protein